MTPFQETRQKVLFDLLDRFPDHGNLTLAKKLYAENSAMFTNVEHARAIIRYYRGAMGDEARRRLTLQKYVKPLRTA